MNILPVCSRCRGLLPAAAVLVLLTAAGLRAAATTPAVTPAVAAATTPTAAAAAPGGASTKLSGLLGPGAEGGPASEVEITSDGMDMNFQAHNATFIGNVKVVEVRMTLYADKMIVYFSADDNKPQRIECTGNVLIEQPGAKRKAKSDRAVYDVIKGTIELMGNPSLNIGGHTLEKVEKITYFRDDERVITTSRSGGVGGERPTIRLTPTGGQADLPSFLPGGTHSDSKGGK